MDKRANCEINDLEYNPTTDLDGEYTVNCLNNGVKSFLIPGMVKIEYTGVLAQNNAESIYAQLGYGDNNNWQQVSTVPMARTGQNTFELLTVKSGSGYVNVAFKDGAGNWDNNSGLNYVFYSE